MITYKNLAWRTVAVTILLLSSGLSHSVLAQDDADKTEGTACFWQLDPKADFPNKGSNHCAPTAIADGLVYLQKVRGLDDLMESTDHDGQITTINDLATAMGTDPTAGTDPNQIMTGLRSYIKERGYSFEHLEVATWRPLNAANKKYLIGAKPDLDWLTAAADEPDTVVICNFGWYKEQDDGSYKRLGGHWINMVGTGDADGEFEVHNPLLTPALQKTNTAITLTAMDDDLTRVLSDGKKLSLSGYYEAEGVGLPFNKKSVTAAVLDGVIVFKIATG